MSLVQSLVRRKNGALISRSTATNDERHLLTQEECTVTSVAELQAIAQDPNNCPVIFANASIYVDGGDVVLDGRNKTLKAAFADFLLGLFSLFEGNIEIRNFKLEGDNGLAQFGIGATGNANVTIVV